MPSSEREAGGRCLWWQDPAGALGKDVRGGTGFSVTRRPGGSQGLPRGLMTPGMPREPALLAASFCSVRRLRPRVHEITLPHPGLAHPVHPLSSSEADMWHSRGFVWSVPQGSEWNASNLEELQGSGWVCSPRLPLSFQAAKKPPEVEPLKLPAPCLPSPGAGLICRAKQMCFKMPPPQ